MTRRIYIDDTGGPPDRPTIRSRQGRRYKRQDRPDYDATRSRPEGRWCVLPAWTALLAGLLPDYPRVLTGTDIAVLAAHGGLRDFRDGRGFTAAHARGRRLRLVSPP